MAQKPITLTELEKNIKEDLYQSEQVQNQIKQYQDLLTSSYKTTEKSAASQASYDISKAYANYLKQQQSLASTAGLESGYKEEVGSGLTKDYTSTYQQAKAQEQQTLSSAASNLQSSYSKFQENLASEIDALAKIKTDIVDVARQQVESQYNQQGLDLYDPKTGALTDWGMDRYMAAILGDSKGFKSALEAAGKTDALKYLIDEYTDTAKLFDELFGFGETYTYDDTAEENIKRRLGVKGYIESFKPEGLKLDREDFQTFDFFDVGDEGVSKLTDKADDVIKYVSNIGLTTAEMEEVLGGDVRSVLEKLGKDLSASGWRTGFMSKTIGLGNWEDVGSQDTDLATREAAIQAYDNLLKALEAKAISKYRG